MRTSTIKRDKTESATHNEMSRYNDVEVQARNDNELLETHS
jgi:hypothetical protein